MIQIVDDFLSEEECDNLISHFNNYGSFQEWDECKYVEITNEDKFKYILHKLNVHTNFKVDWTHVVKWDDDSKQNLHFDISSFLFTFFTVTMNCVYLSKHFYCFFVYNTHAFLYHVANVYLGPFLTGITPCLYFMPLKNNVLFLIGLIIVPSAK